MSPRKSGTFKKEDLTKIDFDRRITEDLGLVYIHAGIEQFFSQRMKDAVAEFLRVYIEESARCKDWPQNLLDSINKGTF